MLSVTCPYENQQLCPYVGKVQILRWKKNWRRIILRDFPSRYDDYRMLINVLLHGTVCLQVLDGELPAGWFLALVSVWSRWKCYNYFSYVSFKVALSSSFIKNDCRRCLGHPHLAVVYYSCYGCCWVGVMRQRRGMDGWKMNEWKKKKENEDITQNNWKISLICWENSLCFVYIRKFAGVISSFNRNQK